MGSSFLEGLERQRKYAKLEEYERKEAEANLKAKIKAGVKAELEGIKAEVKAELEGIKAEVKAELLQELLQKLLAEIRTGKRNEE